MDLNFEIRLPPDPRFAPVAGAALAELANMNGGPGAEMERLAPLLTEVIAALQAATGAAHGAVGLVLRVAADTTHFRAEISTQPAGGTGPTPPEALLNRLRQAFDHVEVDPGGGSLKVERQIPAA